MFDKTPGELNAIAVQKKAEAERRAEQATTQEKKLEEYMRSERARIAEVSDSAKALQRDGEALRMAALLLSAISGESAFTSAHKRFVKCRKQAARMDITVSQSEEAKALFKKSQKDLQEACKHPMVLTTDSYEGSYSHDYDDARHGWRVCVCCGREAKDDNLTGDNSVMPTDGSRVVTRLFNDVSYADYKTKYDGDNGLVRRANEYLSHDKLKDVLKMFLGDKFIARINKLSK